MTTSLQEIFNAVVLEEEQLVVEIDKKSYDSLRVMLVRKFTNYRKQCQSVGIPSYDDRYVSCSFDADLQQATFKLKWLEESQRVRKQYAVYKL